MSLYPGGSIRSKEWKAIRSETLDRADHRCEFCRVDDRTRICRGEGENIGTFMTFEGDVFDDTTGDLLGQADMTSYAGRMVDIILTVAHIDHDPTNNAPDNRKALCQQCHLRHDVEHHRQTRRKKKAIGDLFDEYSK